MIFAQLVNDPGYQQGGGFKYGKNKKEAAEERKRLFRIIEELVLWENTTNERVLEEARAEIRRSWREVCELNRDHPEAAELFNPEKMPGLHDPFAGGGSIPLEAQRLGLEAFASDLNPVAVLINKAMIEIPPKFAGVRPVEPLPPGESASDPRLRGEWPGATGLAEDVRRYGAWMRQEAQKRIGHLYPPVEITTEMARDRPDLSPYVGKKLTVIAWLWARTVKSPNPAFAHVNVPLATSYWLSNKAGKEAYVEPVIEGDTYRFIVKVGTPIDPEITKRGTSAGKWNAFRCLISNAPVTYDYIRGEGLEGHLGTRLMAVIAEGVRGRVYISPTPAMEESARKAVTGWSPELEINYHPRDIKTQNYGLTKYGDLFTQRQLTALNTFTDLAIEARERAFKDALSAGMADDGCGLTNGGIGASAYAEAIGVYLAFTIDRLVDYGSSLATWKASGQQVMQTFKRQAIPMTWDFPESNLLADSAICWINANKYTVDNLNDTARLSLGASGIAEQLDAQTQHLSFLKFVSTDPPYYDNIGYADLSDFFYVWLRRTLRPIFPSLFATLVGA